MAGTGLKVLVVGGTGTISAACVRRALALGMDVHVLNRGLSSARRPLPEGVRLLRADVHDADAVRRALGDERYDVVASFLGFTADDVRAAVALFEGRTAQYLHVSTASVYRKPVRHLPFQESEVRHNPLLAYARDKAVAEDVLTAAYVERGFPAVIVRPSHTYDDAKPPLPGDWTMLERLVTGREIPVPGDGTSLWTVTHADDFAVGFVGLMGNPAAVGEAFHITSDFVYPWDELYRLLGAAAGVEPRLVHIPSDLISLGAPDWRWSELIAGDLAHSEVYDNAKIRRYVPDFGPRTGFAEGARRLLAWRSAHRDLAVVDPAVDAVLDRLTRGYHGAEQVFRSLAPSA